MTGMVMDDGLGTVSKEMERAQAVGIPPTYIHTYLAIRSAYWVMPRIMNTGSPFPPQGCRAWAAIFLRTGFGSGCVLLSHDGQT